MAIACFGAPAAPVLADEVSVAVAANFLEPLRALATEFEDATGHRVLVISGSTGQLYAQIINGAPFDVLLAADQKRPRLLADQGWGDPSSVFTYAIGRLALWSLQPTLVDESSLARLGEMEFRWLSIAQPEVAPYGTAARQVLERLELWESLGSRVVRGQSIAQAFAFVATGNAELGLVALSQALAYEGAGSYAVVPAELHEPIRQDAVLLRNATNDPAALEFLDYLRRPAATEFIEQFGYTVAEH